MYFATVFLLAIIFQSVTSTQNDQYVVRALQPKMADKLARNWGYGAGGPYEYNRRFWRGSPGIGWGYGPNPWHNMFLLAKQMKFTYSKDSPRGYRGPLTNGVARRRMEKHREKMRRKDIYTGKYEHDLHKYGGSYWDRHSIIERQKGTDGKGQFYW